MPFVAQLSDLRVALLSLFTVAVAVPDGVCAQVLDDATAVAAIIDEDLIDIRDPQLAANARVRAARMLNRLCGECRACPRGAVGEGAKALALTSEPPEGWDPDLLLKHPRTR